MKPLKPWLSFSEQLELLRERGLQVEDRAAALDYLKRLGYYRLSGYWYPLLRTNGQSFCSVATQPQLYSQCCRAPQPVVEYQRGGAVNDSRGLVERAETFSAIFYFCLIQQLMRVICPNSSWRQRYKTLLTEAFPRLTSQQLSLKDMGVVEGWEDWPASSVFRLANQQKIRINGSLVSTRC